MKPILTRGNSITDNEIDINDLEKYSYWLPICETIQSAKEVDKEFTEAEYNFWFNRLSNVQLLRKDTDNKRFNLK